MTAKPNRLIHEKSPYLLQHAHNPVEWYPWGDEAFAAARAQDKPLFVSVGYSTCHWCHVMERESFENAEVAELLNRDFIAIKVDREERPEIDDACMAAAQMLAGQGGWPTSIFMTCNAEPFFAGTYFPAEDHGQMPGFKTILGAISTAWRTRRKDVLAQAQQVARAIRDISAMEPPPAAGELDRAVVHETINRLRRSLDARHGGFGVAPKFPPHQSLALLAYERVHGREASAQEMLDVTLQSMAMGGIHDHVGGGFHRYSTDERWLQPHFEKMLYDNALLIRSYVDGYLLLKDAELLAAVDGIVGWLRREMLDPQGGFYSALDADSEGVEGKYYLWSRQEILDCLGLAEGELFCRVFNVELAGNYREQGGEATGLNILHLARPLKVNAAAEGMDEEQLRRRMQAGLQRLREVRSRRVPPSRDEKVLTCWNGLAIAGLAYAGARLERTEYVELARQAAAFVEAHLFRDGRLMRSWRQGQFGPAGFLEDYAYLAEGLVELHEATHEGHWLELAERLSDEMQTLFAAPAGGFFFVGKDQPELLGRLRSPFDAATPSANALAIRVLCRLGRRTGEARYFDSARRHLQAFKGFLLQHSGGLAATEQALSLYLDSAPGAVPDSARAGNVLARSQQGPVTVELLGHKGPARAGQHVELRLVLDIQNGWHVNSHAPVQKELDALAVELKTGPAELVEVHYPPGKLVQLPFSDEPLSVYEGKVEIPLSLLISTSASAGEQEFVVELHAQPCNDRSCQQPGRHELTFNVKIQAT